MPKKKLQAPVRPAVETEYYYRRPLGITELLPAVGVAVGAAMFAFYITRLLLERTPLEVDRSPRARGLERSART